MWGGKKGADRITLIRPMHKHVHARMCMQCLKWDTGTSGRALRGRKMKENET